MKEYDLPKSNWQEKNHLITPNKAQQDVEANTRFKSATVNEGATMPPAARLLQEVNPQGDNYEREVHNLAQPELYPKPPEPPEQQEDETIQQHQETSSNDHGLYQSQRARRVPIKHQDYVPHEEIAFETSRMQDSFDE